MGEENQEIDQLRAKVIASMSAASNANSKPKEKTIGNREEGELSSSEDDDVPTCSVAQPTSVNAPPVEPNHSKSGNKNTNTQSSNSGKSVSGNGPASSSHIQPWTSGKKNYSKHFGTNPMPSKLGNHNTPGWRLPSRAKNNLVISFSDDDSGSGSEGDKTERTARKKRNSLGVDGSKKPPISLQSKSEMLRRTTSNQVNLKKMALGRTFMSSLTKIHGASSRNSGPSFVEQGSSVRSVDPANKMVAGRDRGNNQGMNGKNNNLESLRQQIAIRENELKLQLKSGQQKETISGSSMDYNGAKLISNAAKKGRLASSNTVQLASNEQDKKRLKLSEPTHSKLNSDGLLPMHIPATKSLPELKMPSVENSHLTDNNLVNYNQCSKETHLVTADPGIDEVQEKGDEQVPVSSGNQLGVKDGISTSCCQSDKSSELLDSLTVFDQSLGLPKITPREDVQPAFQLKIPSPKKPQPEGLKHSGSFGEAQSFTFFQNKATCNHNFVRSSEYNELISGGGTLNPASENPSDKHFLSFSESKLGASDVNFSGYNSMDMQSLVKIEELLDKELEEAQDLRHRCELEERNALKAYRKAQTALTEANARCTYLYQRRELFSAKSRALIMEGSNSLWMSGWDKQMEIGLDSSHIVPDANGNLLPTLNPQMQAELEGLNQLSRDSTVRCTHGAVNTSYQHMSGQNLGSEPCSEPDASTSELLHHKDNSAANGICTPSNHPNMSADEDEETFPSDHTAVQVTLECSNKEEDLERRESDTSHRSKRKYSMDGSDDPALLEASLRSELFARLGNRTLSKKSHQSSSKEGTGDKQANIDVGNEATTIRSVKNQSFMEAEQNQVSGTGGTDRSKPSTCELSLQIQDQCHEDECSFDPEPCITADPDYQSSSLIDPCTSTLSPSLLPPSNMRSALGHMKITSPIRFSKLQSGGLGVCRYDIAHEGDSGGNGNDILFDIVGACSTEGNRRGMGDMGSYTCDLSVDPFWSFCMFELRGKCNDEECCWQHFKDYSQRNIKQFDNPGSAECHVRPSSQLEKFTGACKLSQFPHHDNELAPSTYFVGSDHLKADFLSYQSVLARSIGQCWQKGFSISMAVPFSLQKNLPGGVQFFHHNDGCIDVRQGWNRQYMYFQSQDEVMGQLNQGDLEQSLEMALTLSNQDVRKLDAKKKAPFVLSRAIETDPTSVVLWIAYLHIYYRNEKAIGTDDMFSHAIHYNDGSYELWLMYINSRVQLNDRLLAYENALSALCRHASAPDGDTAIASAGILDLFLQMMDFLRMSGNTGKAILRIYALLPLVLDCKDDCSMLPSDILTCLTVSDKCIFWICCVYLLMYKKLPDAVVQQFECEKELLFAIDWPCIQLTADEKHRAAELMEMAVDSIASCINGDSDGKELALRSAHVISLSHVRCVAVLDGLDCCKTLLHKYVKQYPNCLEIVLTFARFCEDCFVDLGFKGFEEILHGWPGEIPGVQCIWNQYAEFALENGGFEFAKELMVQWSQSTWKVRSSQNGIDFSEDNDLHLSLESPSCSIPDNCVAFSNTKDKYFGLLNLSLHRFLQKDMAGARLAMDKALKVAAIEDFKHCVREHVVFFLLDASESIGSTSMSGITSLLNRYLVDARFFPFSEPLSRKFIRNIKKPRVRQLINSMLPPIPFDCSLANLVLEVCYGTSLLPEKYNRISDLVDLVEVIMEILPANYFLALSVCKLITMTSNSAGIVSTGVSFWASSLLLSSIFQAVPVAPEHIWVEAAGIFVKLVEVQEMCERFHRRALSVYPFSVELWKSYFNLSKMTGNMNAVIKAAKERGIAVD
ncbi:uncharacterized protein LOC122649872 isoform X2 [Telopea speciosissima]|uniref:uncharacterized protein LOC122649872 isoform X2 n=1 Tax=Telopea speciosissima TaxID=54955 RepID=UPI001CC3DBA4|nr:uncharacterized protein LOC122649872 isoform X2 [Telopea speciosissima]